MNPLDVAAFWSHVNVQSPSHCWEWSGNLPDGQDGYGRFRSQRAHRVAYALVNGPIPSGMVLRHSCDNPRCCNPHHLCPGTQAQNLSDAVSRKRTARGSGHGRTKLTEDQVRVIRKSADKLADLAERFGVSQSTISYIKSGRSWKYTA